MQWTPNGLVPAGSPLIQSTEDAKGFEPERAPVTQFFEPAPMRTTTRTHKAPVADKPIDVLKLAKQRLKAVKKELKRIASLDKERAELERLIAAAEAKPPAVTLVLTPKTKTQG